MDYPEEFSAQARARIEAERFRAEQSYQQTCSQPPPATFKMDAHFWYWDALHTYILRVFLAFSVEACELGRRRTWTVDEVARRVDEYLRVFTIDTYSSAMGFDPTGLNFQWPTNNWNDNLMPAVEQEFHASAEWHQYRKELLTVAEEQAAAAEPIKSAECVIQQLSKKALTGMESAVPDQTNGNTMDRRAAVEAYIEEVFDRTGKRITKTDIWKSARYKTRTEFERWERGDRKHPNQTADQLFTQILRQKPHLK